MCVICARYEYEVPLHSPKPKTDVLVARRSYRSGSVPEEYSKIGEIAGTDVWPDSAVPVGTKEAIRNPLVAKPSEWRTLVNHPGKQHVHV